MLERDVAPGIHRVEDANTNWYLVEDDGGMTVVDAGVPTSWRSLEQSLAKLGRKRTDIRALVLTHAHFDHIGFAERARRELGIPVWVHENDVPLTRHPTQYSHEASRAKYALTHPQALPYILGFARVGAFFPPAVRRVKRFADGTLDVPGSPEVVFTPGHTLGHCSLLFADRGALIAGDAVVTLNPYTGGRGPQIVARAATADSERAIRSLDAIEETGAAIVLTGHGDPWRDGAGSIAQQARAAGPT